MFFLFFGTRQRTQTLGSGLFDCPFCTVPRTYEHRTTRTWAHVFWVPIFPLGDAFDSVVCTVCHGAWAPAVLAAPTQAGGGGEDAGPAHPGPQGT